jgi:hypothetical protein
MPIRKITLKSAVQTIKNHVNHKNHIQISGSDNSFSRFFCPEKPLTINTY